MGHGFTAVTAADAIQVAILDQLERNGDELRRIGDLLERSQAPSAGRSAPKKEKTVDNPAGSDTGGQVMVDGSADPPPPPVKKTAVKKAPAKKAAASRRKPVKG